MDARQQHLTFWREFTRFIEERKPLVEALREAGSVMSGQEFGAAADRTAAAAERMAAAAEGMAAAIEGGDSLSDAMAALPELFSEAQVRLVQAGEAGGVVDVVARRVLEGIEQGVVPVRGLPREGRTMVRYWRLFALMLDSGVPLLDVLRTLRREVAERELAEVTDAMHSALIEGRNMTDVLDQYPELFPDQLRQAMERAESRGELAETAREVADALRARDLGRLVDGEAFTGSEVSSARSLVNRAALYGIQQGASDLHFEPGPNGNSRVRLRIDGVMHDLEFPRDAPEPIEDPRPVPQQEVVNRLKVMAGLDVAERRLPQDGRIQLTVEEQPIDLRVCAVPTLHGERVAMRILKREDLRFDLEEIGMLDGDLRKVRELLHSPVGAIVASGPTGSGKTTLFYSMLNEINNPRLNCMSVEDPVEYDLEDVSQIEVLPRVGRTTARCVRAVLRQDPDVILIGETRDTEVANLVCQCALTGHVVMTSLNAPDAPTGLKRMVDMGVAPFVVNASVIGLISQRLVRMLCTQCREPIEVPLHSLPPGAREWAEGLGSPTFFEPEGCQQCLGTGYHGRTAIHEVLVPDDAVRQAVAREAPVEEIRRAAEAAGMRPMLICGLEKAARGVTSIQEVLRVVPHSRGS